ncbi:MAG: biotin--[acetyl-CoA-carboxylase] ligase [Prevotella sp.]|jgi:BirA family biotin operon repressor/biotin-[acetyl-CoA-carboxylase] ligase|nr:biotin--[acetyl-CoA-carboxylase] ligase [Prevotella sp.]
MPAIIHIEETDSTNNYLKDLQLKHKLEEGTVVWSDFQTAGKGQQGNSWESEEGKNLVFSIVFYPKKIKANEQFILSQIVSLAVADCLRTYTENITIKWPNDIYWKEKKICGILIENSLIDNVITRSVIGIGININQTKFESDAPNPVSLRQITGECHDLKFLIEGIQTTIIEYYTKWQEDRMELTRQYKNILFRNKGFHEYNDGKSNFMAKIKDVELSGILVLETEDNIERRFAFKEVKYLFN